MGALWIVLAVLTSACAIYCYLKTIHRPTTVEEAPAHMERTHEMDVKTPMFKKLRIRGERERVGRDDALAYLKRHVIEAPRSRVAIVSASGAAGIGKTFLAQIFSEQNRSRHNFIEIFMGPGRSTFDAGVELLDRMNIPTEQTDSHHRLVQALEQVFFRTRGILLLDDVRDESAKILMPAVSKWRVLLTTRDQGIAERLAEKVYRLEAFTVEESMALFKKVLGDSYQWKWREGYASLADHVGRHPYAIRLSAELLKTSSKPRSPHQLLEQLNESNPSSQGSLREEKPGTPSRHQPLLKQCLERLQNKSASAFELLKYLAVCTDDGVESRYFLPWLAAGRPEEQVEHELAMARDLGLLHVESSSSTIMGAASREIRLRLHLDLLAILRELPLERYEKSLQKYLYQTFVATSKNLESGRSLQKQIFHLIRRYQNDSKRLVSIYNDFWIHLYLAGRLRWAYELGNSLLRLYEDDRLRIGEIMGNQAVILQDWGRYHEAMKLHKKEEEICLAYRDEVGLARSYGNQALILKGWGEPGKAMKLHRKEEAICRKLGDRAGLSRTYGHQALIFQDWGKLDAAMALLEKQEMICRELDDRAGQYRAYCSQALILKNWGKYHEAMKLHRKVETICRGLGDQLGLHRSFGNQAIILRIWGKLDDAMELQKKKARICRELDDQAGLFRSYCNQALTLQAMGKRDAAIKLYEKVEAVCQELEDHIGLSNCFWSIGLLLKEKGQNQAAIEKFEESIAIAERVKHPDIEKRKAFLASRVDR